MAAPAPAAGRRFVGRAEDGACIAVDLASTVAAEALHAAWPQRGLDLLDDGSVIVPMGDPPIAFTAADDLVRVESQLALFAAEHLTRLVAVHATLLVWPDLTVVLPGRSHAGKTTFALAAHRQGARVASDEYALIDPASGRATGWHRPLHVRGPEGTTRVDLAEPGAATAVDLVASIRYDPVAGTSLEPMAPADVAEVLLANTVCARRRPGDALAAASAVARSAAGVHGTRGEADGAVAELRVSPPPGTPDATDPRAVGPGIGVSGSSAQVTSGRSTRRRCGR